MPAFVSRDQEKVLLMLALVVVELHVEEVRHFQYLDQAGWLMQAFDLRVYCYCSVGSRMPHFLAAKPVTAGFLTVAVELYILAEDDMVCRTDLVM